ncbi:ABC transporter ATP-binding protein [Bordetella bronchiseptica]|uniref:ABC transporter ATP-binding protein n=1 Tax=Bordetella bronchiseptica TaxID=518 RepID=UPI0004A101E3|nr:ABC transporter ATP-binding protein [Bordetella bronchiseptica]AZW10793.1 ABC transporter ATP-binding protein [Bordetella bronchiseptica]KDD63193.1 ABC transporter, ATP-binding protein [Bordetella bronchiseptica SO10328]QBS67382.1 ABC transporter [Bordetella bronchiseptica]
MTSLNLSMIEGGRPASRAAAATVDAVAGAGDGAALLTASNLSVVYRTSKGPITAVDNLSLQLGAGEFVSVLGPSGCGKSTLIKVFSGLLKPSGGKALLNGTPIDEPRGDVGIVFQQPTLLPWKTVLDNVLVPIRALGMNVAEGRAKAMELLRLVGLEKFASNYPSELSGGMQQRVGIARGLIHDPALLLMDEPFSALDTMTRDRMSIELQRIWMATRKSALFITHSIAEAVFLSDRIVVMSARPGRIIREVTVNLPRPRTLATLTDPEFTRLCGELRELFDQLVQFD